MGVIEADYIDYQFNGRNDRALLETQPPAFRPVDFPLRQFAFLVEWADAETKGDISAVLCPFLDASLKRIEKEPDEKQQILFDEIRENTQFRVAREEELSESGRTREEIYHPYNLTIPFGLNKRIMQVADKVKVSAADLIIALSP